MLLNRDGYGPDGRRLYFLDLGGDTVNVQAPQTQPLVDQAASAAATGKESAQIMAALGEKQTAEAARQFDANWSSAQTQNAENNRANNEKTGILKQATDAQLGIMRETAAQGTEYFNHWKNVGKSTEEALKVEADQFSTAGAKEQFARSAAADLESAQGNEQAQSDRSMAAMGVNPNSGRFAGQRRVQTILNSGARAGATSNARVQADNLGFAKRMDVAGLARGMPGAASSAYTVANNSGNSAASIKLSSDAALLAGMGQGASITGQGLGYNMQGQGLAIQGLGGVLNSQTGTYDASLAANASGASGRMGIIGAGIGSAATIF